MERAMEMELVTAVLDEGMAKMFAEALGEREIHVRIVPRGRDAYFGSVTNTSYEVRRPTASSRRAR